MYAAKYAGFPCFSSHTWNEISHLGQNKIGKNVGNWFRYANAYYFLKIAIEQVLLSISIVIRIPFPHVMSCAEHSIHIISIYIC